MRILVGSVTNAAPEILEAHLKSLQAQEVPGHVKLDYWYLEDPELSEESKTVLADYDVASASTDPKPADAEYSVSDETHHWNKPTFYWLGSQRQRILDKGKEYDAVFMVDTDLVLDPGTLASLVATEKDVVSGVFWTKWSPEMPSLPQVWMEHPYEMQGRGVEAHEHLQNAATRQVWQVAGLGACTLIRSGVLGLVRYYPPLEGLPDDGMWQGEDRTFCVLAGRNHVKLYADAWPSIHHAYRPGDYSGVPAIAEMLTESRKKVYEPGCYVSAKLSAVEEGNLTGWAYYLRTLLDNNSLAPSLVRTLREARVGDDKFVQVDFPVWWPIPEYRGQTKTIRVEVLDIRLNQPHPGLEPDQDFGVYYAG